MIKELTPLQALNKIASITNYDGGENLKALGNSYKKEFAIIETALKEYEGAKNHIKALNKERIENSLKLKALEIIRIVCPNIFWVMRTYTYEEYKEKCSDDTLLQEEYELLKEILL